MTDANNMKAGETNEPEKKPEKCPKCGRSLKLRKGEYGEYYGCSGFPMCNYTRKKDE